MATDHISYRSKMLSAKEAAYELGVEVQTLHNWRNQGKGPTFYRVGGRTIRYRLDDIEVYMKKYRVDAKAQS